MRLVIPIEPAGKARPRVTSHGTYMPHAYQDWRRRFVALVLDQWTAGTLGTFGLRLTVTTKSGRMRPDLDNCLAACLDALQDARVIENDRLCRWFYAVIEKGKTPGLTIELEEVTT